MAQRKEDCASRVGPAWQSVRETIRLMLDPTEDDVDFSEVEGRVVLGLEDVELDSFDADDYRDEETGEIDRDEAVSDHWDELQEQARERFYEYGLSFDYVEPGTFTDQLEGHFRYQICWGGPSEELRFYVNPDWSAHRIEFWFLDWFDGAKIDVTQDEIARLVWDWHRDFAPEAYRQSVDS